MGLVPSLRLMPYGGEAPPGKTLAMVGSMDGGLSRGSLVAVCLAFSLKPHNPLSHLSFARAQGEWPRMRFCVLVL